MNHIHKIIGPARALRPGLLIFTYINVQEGFGAIMLRSWDEFIVGVEFVQCRTSVSGFDQKSWFFGKSTIYGAGMFGVGFGKLSKHGKVFLRIFSWA